MRLPLQQVARVQRVAPQLEDTAQLPRGRSGPEAELLHQTCPLTNNQLLQFAIELGELGVVLDVVDRLVVAGVTLVLPDVDCRTSVWFINESRGRRVIQNVPNVSQSPTSVLQLPTRLTLFYGMPAILGYQLPTNSVYSSTLSGLTSWKTMLCTYLPLARTWLKLLSISLSISLPSSVP